MTFNARVEFPEPLPRRPYDVLITYIAYWANGFFGINDGSVTTFDLAQVTPDERGAFHFALPNFSKDAVTESYHRNALVRFAAVERDTGNLVCLLTPTNGLGKVPVHDLPIKSRYPAEVIFKPVSESPQNKIGGPKPEGTR